MSIKFTVITVTFNAEESIEKTILSVLNQSVAPYEYFIIDGKSTDNTIKLAQKFVDDFANKGVKYHIISEPDSGLYNAMNKGINLAIGDFISYINAGDWYEKDALSIVEDSFIETSFDMCYGGIHYLKQDGTTLDKMSKLDKHWITSRHWNHPSMFLRTSLYKRYMFDEEFKVYADFDLYLKLRKTDIKIKIIDKVLASFVAGGVSTDPKKRKERSKEKYLAYRHNGYSRKYWLEAYGWEFIKSLYFKIHS